MTHNTPSSMTDPTSTSSKSRRLRRRPRKLGAIIDEINRLDPRVALVSFHDATLIEDKHLNDGASNKVKAAALALCLNSEQYDRSTKTAIRKIVARLHHRSEGDHVGDVEDKIYCYEFFRLARLHLQGVARMNALLRPTLQEGRFSQPEIGQIIREWFTGSLEQDELTRIRECAVCYSIFWAGRLDQWRCSSKCNHVLHSRRTREKYSQGYYQGARLTRKEQTEENRQGKKPNGAKRGK